MKYLLDTNTVSFLMRGDRSVVDALARRERSDVLLPQPVIAEILFGLARLRRSARRTRLQARFRRILDELPRAPWNDDVSESFARIKAALQARGATIEDIDVAIAAHAMAHGAVLVSDDLRHMARIRGLRVETWRHTEA